MRAETNGKLLVAMLVSILAFGTGTGTALLMGYSTYNNPYQMLNLTKVGEFPIIHRNQPDMDNNLNSPEDYETPSPTLNPYPYNNNDQINNTNNTTY